MLRKDLLLANASIFKAQGEALALHASPMVRVLVVGNPCNTNALITSSHAHGLDSSQISALTRLDQNRCTGMIAAKLECPARNIGGVIIWGNHSATQVPDASFATVTRAGSTDVIGVASQVDAEWLIGELVQSVQQRGKAVIDKRGSSSAGSAANSICDHLRDWFLGSAGRTVSMVVPSNGTYGVAEGLFVSLPVTCSGNWQYQIRPDVPMADSTKQLFAETIKELLEERMAVVGE
jgi:malate dehydrogenase